MQHNYLVSHICKVNLCRRSIVGIVCKRGGKESGTEFLMEHTTRGMFRGVTSSFPRLESTSRSGVMPNPVDKGESHGVDTMIHECGMSDCIRKYFGWSRWAHLFTLWSLPAHGEKKRAMRFWVLYIILMQHIDQSVVFLLFSSYFWVFLYFTRLHFISSLFRDSWLEMSLLLDGAWWGLTFRTACLKRRECLKTNGINTLRNQC